MKLVLSSKKKMYMKKHMSNFIAKFFVFFLLLCFAYVILYPFLFKILASFMSQEDLTSTLVDLVPMYPTIDNYEFIFEQTDFVVSAINNVLYALVCGIFTTAAASLVGYGIARFKFKGRNLLTLIVVVIMLMPLQTLSIPIYLNFRFFDPFGILTLIKGEGINTLSTIFPMFIMSATGLGFRGCFFIIFMRQYYIGIPKELVEAAEVDGAGPYRTFISIILPIARTMMVVIFSLSFAWQWTDTFFADIIHSDVKLLPNLVTLLSDVRLENANYYLDYVRGNTAEIMAILPLIILYCILQRQIIQGVETSGIVG